MQRLHLPRCYPIVILLIIAFQGYSSAAPPLTEKELLGKAIFFDRKLSQPDGQSCSSCHSPRSGFADPIHSLPVSRGVLPGRFGARNSPSIAYASFSPPFHYDPTAETYVGGLFWDGRADGLSHQAQAPFLNKLEMHNPNRELVLRDLIRSGLGPAFTRVYGSHSLDSANVDTAYLQITDAIAAYEKSVEVSPFTSKYDFFLKGQAKLTPLEAKGLALFNGKANCFACHPSTIVGNEPGPLFTDFSYDNIGIPKNWQSPFLYLPRSLNPDGVNFVDQGLANTVAKFDPVGASLEVGKFKVPTLRNLKKTAPYGHNGYFFTIKEIVMFYNRRDVSPKIWPPAEVPQTVNSEELGNLGMTDAEEDALVAFLKTLDDGYRPH